MTTNTDIRPADFWGKLRKAAKHIPFTRDVVAMWYCMMDSTTPLWVKAQIGAAIIYFISPVDAIPDVLVPVGYTDDAGVIALCLATVRAFVTTDHYRKADKWLS